jgi:hypothetical protein
VGGAERVVRACAQWRAEQIQTRERQRHASQGRTRFERARERCGKAEASDAELLRKDQRCIAGLLREKREHSGVDPNYATVISGSAGVAVSKMQLKCSMKCWPREK